MTLKYNRYYKPEIKTYIGQFVIHLFEHCREPMYDYEKNKNMKRVSE
jgi:hypothetical protein